MPTPERALAGGANQRLVLVKLALPLPAIPAIGRFAALVVRSRFPTGPLQ
jgi:hypothetical protein